MNGKLFIISGQSGVGKNTILKGVLEKHPEIHRAVTFTTRQIRPQEIPGEDHFFVYEEKFQDMIKNDEFLEYAEVHGEMYGTPKEQINLALEQKKDVLMEIDVQGAKQIKEKMPEAKLIFIKFEPGNLEQIIRKRIINDPNRGKTKEEEIKRRLESAKKENRDEKYYDFYVNNPEGNPEKAIEEVSKIIKEN